MYMNYKNIFKCLFVAGTLSVSTSSCSDWLEVDMEDSILETTLFSTNEGFLTALNGVYSSLNQSSLYVIIPIITMPVMITLRVFLITLPARFGAACTR